MVIPLDVPKDCLLSQSVLGLACLLVLCCLRLDFLLSPNALDSVDCQVQVPPCYLGLGGIPSSSVLGLTCFSDSRFLKLCWMPSPSVLGLIFLSNPHYLIPLGVSMGDSHSLGHFKGGCIFPWACQGLGFLPTLICLELSTLPIPKAFEFWLASGLVYRGSVHCQTQWQLGLTNVRPNPTSLTIFLWGSLDLECISINCYSCWAWDLDKRGK
jgi:hypothetical protein